MKKILVITLILSLAVFAVGCSAQDSQSTSHTDITDVTQAVSETATESVTEVVTQAPTQSDTVASISEDKAKEIALSHAGLSEADVTGLIAKLDYDDGVLSYEIDFRQGNTEYDYEIDAKTGEILSYDKDIDD